MIKEIEWAKRVEPKLIKRLYASDAKHIQDMELADEVGFGLYARAISLIKVNRAHNEHIIDCPSCEKEVKMGTDGFVCYCGWNMTQKEYHLTYRRKQLVAISIVPFAEKFISDWEKAKNSYTEKMKAIDYLIHCFHYELEEDRDTARPAVVNFIDCNLDASVELIFELAYDYGSNEYNEHMRRWIANAKTSWMSDDISERENYYRDRNKE